MNQELKEAIRELAIERFGDTQENLLSSEVDKESESLKFDSVTLKKLEDEEF